MSIVFPLRGQADCHDIVTIFSERVTFTTLQWSCQSYSHLWIWKKMHKTNCSRNCWTFSSMQVFLHTVLYFPMVELCPTCNKCFCFVIIQLLCSENCSSIFRCDSYAWLRTNWFLLNTWMNFVRFLQKNQVSFFLSVYDGDSKVADGVKGK